METTRETMMAKVKRRCDCAERLWNIIDSVGRNRISIQSLAKKHSLCFQRTSDRFVGYLIKKRIIPPLDTDCDCEAANAINKISWILHNPIKSSESEDEDIASENKNIVFPILPAIKEKMGKIKALFR